MVYVELNGRLGNYLFQIATAATLAERNNSEFAVVCHEKYLLAEPDNCTIYKYVQQFKNNIFKNITILNDVANEIHYFKQESALFSPIKYCNNIYLYGTFQSEKYFDSIIARKYFQIPTDLKDSLQKRYGHILAKGVSSINVRRGDYLKCPHQYNITSMSYFKNAMTYIGDNTYFLIISDDIEWCKRHFKGDNIFFSDNNKPLEDLYLQSLCRNNIISNSTFGWWGAWLNENTDKIVIAPRPWYGKTFSYIPTSDLIPQNWVQIENQMSLFMRIRAWKIIGVKTFKSRIKNLLHPLYHSIFKRLGHLRRSDIKS